MPDGWPWPRGVAASRAVPRTGVPPDPACAGAWQALGMSCVLCWVSPPPGKSQCGAVGLSRPHTAAGHHMRGASSPGITEPREPGEEAGAPAPWPFHLSPASLPLSCLPLWPRSLFLRCLCSLCTWPLFPAFPPALPLHLAVLAASAPLLSAPLPRPCAFILPAPTSPALASCPHASSAPPSPPSPAQNLPFPWREGKRWPKVPPGVLHPRQKSFCPFLPSPPGCFQGHPPPWVCPALSQPGILLPPPSAYGSNELGMLVDSNVSPCCCHPPSSSLPSAGGQRKGTRSCSSQGRALLARGLWSRDKGKWWVSYSRGSQGPVSLTGCPKALGCPWCFLGQVTTCSTERVKNIWVQTYLQPLQQEEHHEQGGPTFRAFPLSPQAPWGDLVPIALVGLSAIWVWAVDDL